MIDHPEAFEMFKGKASLLAAGRANIPGNPLNPDNYNFDAYQAGLAKLKSSFIANKAIGFERVNFLPVFHGTSASLAKVVAETGPRPLRSTDGGYFGGEVYASLEAA